MRTVTGPLAGDEYDGFVGTHVAYELQSVGVALAVLGRHAPGTAEHRTAVESFLVHARILDDFFGRGRQHHTVRPDDVLAADLDGWTPQAVLEPAERRAVDELLGGAGAGAKDDWPVLALARRVIAVTERWIPLLPAADGRRAIDQALDHAHRQLLGRPAPTVAPLATSFGFNVGRRPEPPAPGPGRRR